MASYQELLEQQQQLAAKIEQARKREMASAVEQVRALVNEYKLTPQDIFTNRKGRTGAKVPPKYRDPVSGKTWSGRGKAPNWIDGKDREQFLIR